MTKTSGLSSLSLFFPAHNEAESVQELIRKANQVAQNMTDDYEIIIINDGSTDQTREFVESLMNQYPKLRLINHAVNQGYGGAVFSGFQNASKEWIFFSDADLQFDLSEITKLVKHTPQYEVIIGFRKNRSDPFIRSLNTFGWKILNRIFFNLKVKDIDCAFKLIRASAIKPLLPQITSRGAMISAEFLIRLQNAEYVIKEIPVTHLPRKSGSSSGANLKVILRAFREMWKVFWILKKENST